MNPCFEKRRNSIFGKKENRAQMYQQAPIQNQPVMAMQLVTRDTFKDIEIRTLTSLEHIAIFLDLYEQRRLQFPGHNLRMIDFCNRSVYLELTVIAERLGYLTSEAFTGGLVIL